MGLGFSKDFILFGILSVLIGIGFSNWRVGVSFFILYSICKIIWKILT